MRYFKFNCLFVFFLFLFMFNVCLVLLTFGIIFIYMYVAHVLLIMSVLLPFHLTTVSCFLVLFFPFQKKIDKQTQ